MYKGSEKEKQTTKLWKLNHPEELKIINARYELKNKKSRQLETKQWQGKNPEKIKEYRIKRMNSWVGKYGKWKDNAKVRGIEWSLTMEQLQSMPLICHYTGQELTLEINNFNTVSLDRIDSNKGYVLDNVVFCLTRINVMKSNMTKEEFISLCGMVWNNK